MFKKFFSILIMVLLLVSITACSTATSEANVLAAAVQESAPAVTDSSLTVSVSPSVKYTDPIVVEYDNEDLEVDLNQAGISDILLTGDAITYEGNGASIEGSQITITSAGVYRVSGDLLDGQIIVDTQDSGSVTLLLNGIEIANSSSAPIYIKSSEKTVLHLVEGTQNIVSDSVHYLFEDETSDEPNATIFSQDDLTINGAGALTINSLYNHGIVSKDDLKITSGTLMVEAVNDGIKGKDSVAVKDGEISIIAGGDGIQAYNDTDSEKGYIALEGGSITIYAGLDGIQAETRLLVNGADLDITSGGGSANSSTLDTWGNWGLQQMPSTTTDTESAKGLKAGIELTINSGQVQIDSSDDALHSNSKLTINAGELKLASGDDGMHSDTSLEINGGAVTITNSYEGIESASLTINAGVIQVNASDDGINAAGGVDGSAINGRPGQNSFAFGSDYNLYVNGGTIQVDAMGDGIDINGSIEMSGGTVIVNGPTSNQNGALDYLGTFNISGGLLIAAGSAGMAQAPSSSSTQNSLVHTFSEMQAAGDLIHIGTEDGQEILTFAPGKEYQSIVVSSPELKNGTGYLIYTGGSSTGELNAGLYTGGDYTPGDQVAYFTISETLTATGVSMGSFPGGPGGGGPTRPMRP